MKIRDVIKSLEEDGWLLVATRGSHRQHKHMSNAGRLTIAGHPGDDVSPGTLNSIRKQAKLEKGE